MRSIARQPHSAVMSTWCQAGHNRKTSPARRSPQQASLLRSTKPSLSVEQFPQKGRKNDYHTFLEEPQHDWPMTHVPHFPSRTKLKLRASRPTLSRVPRETDPASSTTIAACRSLPGLASYMTSVRLRSPPESNESRTVDSRSRPESNLTGTVDSIGGPPLIHLSPWSPDPANTRIFNRDPIRRGQTQKKHHLSLDKKLALFSRRSWVVRVPRRLVALRIHECVQRPVQTPQTRMCVVLGTLPRKRALRRGARSSLNETWDSSPQHHTHTTSTNATTYELVTSQVPAIATENSFNGSRKMHAASERSGNTCVCAKKAVFYHSPNQTDKEGHHRRSQLRVLFTNLPVDLRTYVSSWWTKENTHFTITVLKPE